MTQCRWVAFDRFEHEIIFCSTEEEAKAHAKRMLDEYKDSAVLEGWPEIMDIGYAKVCMITKPKVIADRAAYTDEAWLDEGFSLDFDQYLDYELVPVGEEG